MPKSAISKIRDFYTMTPDAPFYQAEFGFYSLERWIEEGHISRETDLGKVFHFEEKAVFELGGLGWCEAEMVPAFEVKVLEDRGEHELVQDHAGRAVLCFKGRKSGFMPEYVDHPVKNMKTWEDNVRWRLDCSTSERLQMIREKSQEAADAERQGMIICQNIIGGYMYLRSLIGPLDLLFAFCDQPELIHACMQTWFELADHVMAEHQKHVTVDEIFLAEDICYNHGSLISPDMMREFLFPYYQQLIENAKKRQSDKNRKLHIQIDTDGNCIPVIDLYKEIGMDHMSPFEVASGCDVVEVRKKYPELLIRGGFDKRILAGTKEGIEREVERIMPFMKRHGGYIPLCDHGVPAEVSFENYMFYRQLMQQYQ